MAMVTLASIVVNALWIIGLAIILAALAYSDWLARETGMGLRQALTQRGFVMATGVGMALIALGLAGSARGVERILWLILTLACGAQTWRAWRTGSLT